MEEKNQNKSISMIRKSGMEDIKRILVVSRDTTLCRKAV